MPSPFDNFMQSQQAQAPASSFDDYMKSQTPPPTEKDINQFVDKTFGTESVGEKLQRLSKEWLRPTGTMGGAVAGGELGSFAGPVGTAGGSLIGALLGNLGIQGLQHASPNIFGNPPQGDPTTNAAIEGGGQELGGAIAKPIVNLGGNAIKALSGKLPEALAPYFEQFPGIFKTPLQKVGVQEYTDKMGGLLPEQQIATEQQIAGMSRFHQSFQNTAKQIVSMSDGTPLSSAHQVDTALNFISDNPGMGRKFLTDEAYKKVFTDSVDFTTTGEPIFNPKTVLQKLDSDKLYAAAIPSQQLSNTRQLMKELTKSQEQSGFLKYNLSAGRLGISLALGAEALMGRHVSTFGVAIGAAEAPAIALYGLEKSMGAIMKNPSTARAMIEAARTPITAPSSTMTGKIILNALKGTTGYMLQDNKGNMVSASIDDKGKIVPDLASLTQGTQQ